MNAALSGHTSIQVPTVLSHAVFGAALYMPFRNRVPRHFAILGAFAAVVPDFDVVGFRFGIDYADLLGHRGLSHSLTFAAAFAAVMLFIAGRSVPGRERFPTWLYLALAIASHGVFDAFTNGGLGVALLAPFSNQRFFFPWQPIEVSPLGLSRSYFRATPYHLAAHRSHDDDPDGERGQRWNGDRGRDRRCSGGRKDGDRRGGREPGVHPALVHRLRPARPAEDRHRGGRDDAGDRRHRRRRIRHGLGDRVDEHETGHLGVDVAVETSGSVPALHQAIRATRFGGTICMISFYGKEATGLYLGDEFHVNRLSLVSIRAETLPGRDAPVWDLQRLVDGEAGHCGYPLWSRAARHWQFWPTW